MAKAPRKRKVSYRREVSKCCGAGITDMRGDCCNLCFKLCEIVEINTQEAFAKSNPTFYPSISLLAKLRSIAGHTDEMLSPDGHEFDRDALQGLLNDPEVKSWLDEMEEMALIPKKRN